MCHKSTQSTINYNNLYLLHVICLIVLKVLPVGSPAGQQEFVSRTNRDLFLQCPGSHLLSALVRFPVHSFTSSGHSQGHSHSFCSILQGREHRENPSDRPYFNPPVQLRSSSSHGKGCPETLLLPQEQGLLCPAPGVRVTS